jgi:hypothetical protein
LGTEEQLQRKYFEQDNCCQKRKTGRGIQRMKKKVPGAKWSCCWAGTKFCSSGQSTYKFSRRRFANKMVLRMSGSSRVQTCDSLTARTVFHKIEFDNVGFLQYQHTCIPSIRRRDFDGYRTLIFISIEVETLLFNVDRPWTLFWENPLFGRAGVKLQFLGKSWIGSNSSIYLFILYVVIVI